MEMSCLEFVCWVGRVWGWWVEYHGQRLLGAAWGALVNLARSCWWHTSASHCVWLRLEHTDTKEPHLSAVWEVSSQQPHLIFFRALVLNVLEVEFLLPLPHFTAVHRNISFLEPLHCFLRGNCMIVREHIQGLLLCLVIASEFVLTVFLLIQTRSFSIILFVLRRGFSSACLECSLCKILPAVKLARKISKLHICTAGPACGKCYRYALVWKPRSK